ncbi:hypothetical protein [Streptomyces sp. CBMA123]|uniref:hypothetical protein n=1 Tax=Streptomyces sp. CBMA123 TaxID=1896313 RepID=UPI001661B085|nr:hypothetical protein [Streptomyces sp. CBMA123]
MADASLPSVAPGERPSGAARLDGWALVVDGRFVAGPADRSRPLVTSTAELAVLRVRQALEEGLIDADAAPVLR